MKKIFFFVVFITFLSNTLYAVSQTTEKNTETSYEQYMYEEFPDWLHKVRRAESLFIGSLPVTFGAVTLVSNLFNGNTANPLTPQDYLIRFGFSAAVSISLVLIDFILGELEHE